MRIVIYAMTAGLAAIVAGCTEQPPPLIAFPAPGKPYAEFVQDDQACRLAVAQPPPQAVGQAAPQSPNLAYAQCMVAHGDKVGPPPVAPRPVYPAYGYVYSGFGDTYPWLYGGGRY